MKKLLLYSMLITSAIHASGKSKKITHKPSQQARTEAPDHTIIQMEEETTALTQRKPRSKKSCANTYLDRHFRKGMLLTTSVLLMTLGWKTHQAVEVGNATIATQQATIQRQQTLLKQCATAQPATQTPHNNRSNVTQG